nr:S-layer family protein [Anabaena catenula]
MLIHSQQSVFAQLKPDHTLGAESSVVKPIDSFSDRIEKGATRGVNLFHSFKDFNVGANRSVYFANPAGIENILNRVTGGNPSNILGKLGVEGTANLFLINPQGIVFGKNASLDIRGSFIGSTASSIKFVDGFEFNVNGSQITPLLTIRVPLGLQYGVNPGKIRVQGDGNGIRTTSQLIDTTAGLRVEPNQTLALVGGDISLEGATLKTAGGRIELGSVGDNSFVSLTPINKGFSLGYEGTSNFKNIQLSQQAAVDASGVGTGDIQVIGKRVTLTNGSRIETSTLGAAKGGNLVVNATELIEIIGHESGLYAQVYADAKGDAGDLTVNTSKLLVQDEASVDTTTYGAGKGGNLTINATDSIQLIGAGTKTSDFFTGLLATSMGGEGDAGNLTINTSKLLVQDGAQVGVGTFGSGNGGNLTVNATDSIQLIGTGTNANGFPSGLLAGTAGGEGDAGNLIINTPKLLVQDGAQILTGTNSAGSGGDLTINIRQLLVQDGAQINTGTTSAGKSGNLTINATDSIQVIGINSTLSAASGVGFGLTGSNPDTTGDGGNLTINTPKLLLQDGAVVTVNAISKGKAGNLEVNSRSINLDNNATISANTLASNTNQDFNKPQATINIRSQNLILRRGSNITTNATGNSVIGGNINIETDVLAAINNSDIRADSTDFRGGQIQIKAQGIFGIEFRDAITPKSDITATGANPQLSGTVQIIKPDADPLSGLIDLPDNLLDAESLIGKDICSEEQIARGSSFTITGKGGLPVESDELISNSPGLVEWVTRSEKQQTLPLVFRPLERINNEKRNIPNHVIQQAQGWIIAADGKVILTAEAPKVTLQNAGLTHPSCHIYSRN